MNNQTLNRRERKVLAKFLSQLAKDPNTPPVIHEAVSDITMWFLRYLDTDTSLVIEKCLEGYSRQNRNIGVIGH